MSKIIKQLSNLKIIKMFLFAVITVGGIIILITSMITNDWEMGVTGLLALILSQLNDIEIKIDKKENK